MRSVSTRVPTFRCGRPVLLLVIPLAVAVSCRDSASSDGISSVAAIPTVVTDLIPFAANDALRQVRDMTVDDQSRVWVLTGIEPFVHVYASDGRLLGSYGRVGDGPREMRNPFAMVSAEDGVDVWDIGRMRMLRVSSEGEVVQADEFLPPHRGVTRGDLEDITYYRPFQLRTLGGRYVLASYRGNLSGSKDLLHAAIVAGDGKGHFDTLVDLEDEFNKEAISQRAEQLLALPLWTTCRGTLVVFDAESREVIAINGERHEALAALPEGAQPLTDTHIKRYLWHVMGLEIGGPSTAEDTLRLTHAANEITSSARYLFPQHVPPAVSFKCGSNGELWLQQFDTSDNPLGFGRRWWRLGGVRPSRVTFPTGFQPFVFLDSLAIGVSKDELDVERIASAPLP